MMNTLLHDQFVPELGGTRDKGSFSSVFTYAVSLRFLHEPVERGYPANLTELSFLAFKYVELWRKYCDILE